MPFLYCICELHLSADEQFIYCTYLLLPPGISEQFIRIFRTQTYPGREEFENMPFEMQMHHIPNYHLWGNVEGLFLIEIVKLSGIT